MSSKKFSRITSARVDINKSIKIPYLSRDQYSENRIKLDVLIGALRQAYQCEDPVIYNGKRLSEVNLSRLVTDYGLEYSNSAVVNAFVMHECVEVGRDYKLACDVLSGDVVVESPVGGEVVFPGNTSLRDRLKGGLTNIFTNHIFGACGDYGSYRNIVAGNGGSIGEHSLLDISGVNQYDVNNEYPVYLDGKIPVLYEKCIEAGVGIGAVIRLMSLVSSTYNYCQDNGWEASHPKYTDLPEGERSQYNWHAYKGYDYASDRLKLHLAEMLLNSSPTLKAMDIGVDTPIDDVVLMDALIKDFDIAYQFGDKAVLFPSGSPDVEVPTLSEIAEEINADLDKVPGNSPSESDELVKYKFACYDSNVSYSSNHEQHRADGVIARPYLTYDFLLALLNNEKDSYLRSISEFPTMIDVFVKFTKELIAEYGSVAVFINNINDGHDDAKNTFASLLEAIVEAAIADLNPDSITIAFNAHTPSEIYDASMMALLFKDAPHVTNIFGTQYNAVVQFDDESYPRLHKLSY